MNLSLASTNLTDLGLQCPILNLDAIEILPEYLKVSETSRGDMVRKRGVEPLPLAGLDPKSSASANSATFAVVQPELMLPYI